MNYIVLFCFIVLIGIAISSCYSFCIENKKTKYLALIHEYGHAIIAEELGFSVRDMCINTYNAYTAVEFPKEHTKEILEKMIMTYYAGMISEVVIGKQQIKGTEFCYLADNQKIDMLLDEYSNQETEREELRKKLILETMKLIRKNEEKISEKVNNATKS